MITTALSNINKPTQRSSTSKYTIAASALKDYTTEHTSYFTPLTDIHPLIIIMELIPWKAPISFERQARKGKEKLQYKPEPALTFGIEIEFVLATFPTGMDDPHPKDLRPVKGIAGDAKLASREGFLNVQTHIADTLNAHNFEARSRIANKIEDFTVWMVSRDLLMAPDDRYEYYPVELQSPIFYSTEEGYDEVRKVVEVLTSNYRIHTNESCGLHVHVGDEDKGLPLEVFRNLLAYIWSFEPQLSQIHPSHRLSNSYCYSFGSLTELGKLHYGGHPRKAGLERIIKAESFEELRSLSVKKEQINRPGYHFEGLLPPLYPDTKRTIEFRQHEATLDAVRIVHWLRVCTGLIRYARRPREEVEKFCLENVDKSIGECSLLRILTNINQSDSALYYQMRLIEGEVEPGDVFGNEFQLRKLSLW